MANSYSVPHLLQHPLSQGGAAPHCKFIKMPAIRKHVTCSPLSKAMNSFCTRTDSHRYHNFVPSYSSATPPSDLIESDRNKLKEQLLSEIGRSDGTLNEDCMRVISSLGKLNPNPDITLVPHLYTGCFEGISSSFKGTGRPGEGQKLIGNSPTLGRAAFNAFKPTDLDILFKQVYNHVGIETRDGYSFLIPFSVTRQGAGAADDPNPTMEGLLINRATFSISDSSRMDIKFVSCTMVPVNPQKDLHAWLQLFKDENPTMDEKGSVTVLLPPTKGFTDYIYLDDNLRITIGNRGGAAVAKDCQSLSFVCE